MPGIILRYTGVVPGIYCKVKGKLNHAPAFDAEELTELRYCSLASITFFIASIPGAPIVLRFSTQVFMDIDALIW